MCAIGHGWVGWRVAGPAWPHRPVVVSAPGKIILHGEHSVVYGKLAIAGSINLRTELAITVEHTGKLELELTVRVSATHSDNTAPPPLFSRQRRYISGRECNSDCKGSYPIPRTSVSPSSTRRTGCCCRGSAPLYLQNLLWFEQAK